MIVVCSSCGKDIKPEDDKHCFWDEDIEDGIKPECLDCHLDREYIIRDFEFLNYTQTSSIWFCKP